MQYFLAPKYLSKDNNNISMRKVFIHILGSRNELTTIYYIPASMLVLLNTLPLIFSIFQRM